MAAGRDLPSTLASTVLLHLVRVDVDVALLGKVLGEVGFVFSGTIGNGSMVAVIGLV